MKTNAFCLECGQPISSGVNEFSRSLYGHPLCLKDQFLLEESGVAAQVVDLYLALKSRKFPVILGYYDGCNHVDIALPGKLYIECTDGYHYTNHWMIAELSCPVYSQEKKIPTIIIPNSLLSNSRDFAHTVSEISKACRVMSNQVSILSLVPAYTSVQLQ